MKRAGTVLAPMLKKLGIESGVMLFRIRNEWSDIFQEPLSSQMYPSNLSEGVLLISVASSAWLQQLTYSKKAILQKLTSYGVTNVRLMLGRVPTRKKSTEDKQAARKLSDTDISLISSLISELKDNSLKESIRKAAEKSITSGKNLQS